MVWKSFKTIPVIVAGLTVVRDKVIKGDHFCADESLFEVGVDNAGSFRRIDVKLIEGNLKALEATWAFEETPDGTVVDYRVRIQPSLPAPRFIVRRNVNKGMPAMLACIRGLAGGSGSATLENKDLARCPGPLPVGRSAQ